MSDVLDRLATALGVDRRLLMVAVGVLGVLLIWGSARWASGPAWVPLLSGVPMETVSTVTSSLEEAGVEYRLAAGGSSVEVPEEAAARARVALAEQGIPATGSPGFELFDQPAWGMTDFTQKVNYRRALEGELARTVAEMKGVERARVHLTLQRSSFLEGGGEPAEASVVVALRSGARPEDAMVEGVALLVSSAVEGLDRDRVTVLDDRGRTLSAPGAAGAGAGLSGRHLKVRQRVESYLEGKAEEILHQMMGAGNASVQVAADLNFDQIDRTVQSVDPSEQVTLQEDRSEIIPSTDEQGASKVETRSVYETSRRIETLVTGGARVERLSVSVLVNDGSEDATAAAAGTSGEPLPVDTEAVELAVSNAVGLIPERGDRISVIQAPIRNVTALPTGPSGGLELLPLIETLRRPVLGMVGAGLAFFLVLRLLREIRTMKGREQSGALESGADQAALSGSGNEPSLQEEAVGALQSAAEEPELDMSDPEMAARVVRAFISED